MDDHFNPYRCRINTLTVVPAFTPPPRKLKPKYVNPKPSCPRPKVLDGASGFVGKIQTLGAFGPKSPREPEAPTALVWV